MSVLDLQDPGMFKSKKSPMVSKPMAGPGQHVVNSQPSVNDTEYAVPLERYVAIVTPVYTVCACE